MGGRWRNGLVDTWPTVADVLGWLAVGQTPEGILADYPELTLDDVRACLAYAAEREDREVRLRIAA